jgi:hypothetical protein
MTDRENPGAGGTARGAKGWSREGLLPSTDSSGRKAKRVTAAERARLKARLPYGLWIEPDGSCVLFNRYYWPIWRRSPGRDGVTTAVTGPIRWDRGGKIWIRHVRQEFFFHDGITPWHNAAARELCEEIFALFDVPGDEGHGSGRAR